MSQVFGKYWKTNKRDLVEFANACSIVMKHKDRTDDDLINVAEIMDSLLAGMDITVWQKSKVIQKYQTITGRMFIGSNSTSFEHPWTIDAMKARVFHHALLRHDIDINNFDPYRKWTLEPGVEKRTAPPTDLSLLMNRGATRLDGANNVPMEKYKPGPMATLRNFRGRAKASSAVTGIDRSESRGSKLVARARQRISDRVEADQVEKQLLQ